MSSETVLPWVLGALALGPALILGWCFILNNWIYPGRGRSPRRV